jgi:AbrB family looped-hinge helix DNA binding protein
LFLSARSSTFARISDIPIIRQRHPWIPQESAKRGTIVVPAKLRKRFCLDEGSFVTAEAREDGILLRPAAIVPIEKYSPQLRPNFFFPTPQTLPTIAAPAAK